MRLLVCSTILVGSAVLTFACSALRDGGDSCASDPTECVTSPIGLGDAGDLPAGPWSCLSNPAPAPTAYPDASVTLNVQDWLSGDVPAGLTICPCESMDLPPPDAGFLPCTKPLPPGCLTPTDGSNITIMLPTRPDFFLTFEAPGSIPDSFYFSRRPIQSEQDIQPPFRMISLPTAETIAQGLGVNLNPMLGIVVIRVFDCQGNPADQVTCDLGAMTSSYQGLVPFTVQGGVVTNAISITDNSGQCGFANVPPGDRVARAFNSTGQAVGQAPYTARPSWITVIEIRQ